MSTCFFKGFFCLTSHILLISMDDSTMALILTEEAKHYLTQHVMREEVTYTLNLMHLFKASGPDGFQGIFFKQFWHIVRDDIV